LSSLASEDHEFVEEASHVRILEKAGMSGGMVEPESVDVSEGGLDCGATGPRGAGGGETGQEGFCVVIQGRARGKGGARVDRGEDSFLTLEFRVVRASLIFPVFVNHRVLGSGPL